MLPTIKTEVVSSRDSVFKVIQCHFPIAERSSKVTKLLREAAALSSALGVRQVKELKKGSEAQCGGLACSCSAGREGEGFSEGITGLGVGWAGEPLRGRCSTAQGQKRTPWLSGHLSQQYHSPGWRSIPLWMAAARAVCCWRYSHSGHGPLPCSLGAFWQVTPQITLLAAGAGQERLEQQSPARAWKGDLLVAFLLSFPHFAYRLEKSTSGQVLLPPSTTVLHTSKSY